MIRFTRYIILYVLLLGAAAYVYARSEVAVPAAQPLDSFAQVVGDWQMTGQARFDERTLEVLKPTDYLSRSYRSKTGEKVSLYIGYHDGGPQSGPIHSPRQCLPGSGWSRLRDETRTIDVSGEPVSFVSAIYQQDTDKQMFLYWFQVRDQLLTDEYSLKFEQIKNSIIANRRDSSFIRLAISVPEDETTALQVGEKFIRDFYPSIKKTLPQ